MCTQHLQSPLVIHVRSHQKEKKKKKIFKTCKYVCKNRQENEVPLPQKVWGSAKSDEVKEKERASIPWRWGLWLQDEEQE